MDCGVSEIMVYSAGTRKPEENLERKGICGRHRKSPIE
jgi:hypothetical protein